MRGAAAGRRRRPYSRRRVAGEGGTGAAGLGLGPGLAVEDPRRMRNPPLHQKRGFPAWTVLARVRGGPARRRSAGVRRQGG